MNEWENNGQDENEPGSELPETPETEQPTEPTEPETPTEPESQAGNETEPTQPQIPHVPQETPSYVWNGKQQKRRHVKKRAGVFCAVAAVCLLLAAALFLPTILNANAPQRVPTDTSGESSTSQGGNSSAILENSRYEVSETVKITDHPYEENNVRIEVYERCAPSCVTIYVTFGSRYSGYAIGSGFVLTEDGYIATNQHVVEDGAEFKVIFYDGTEYEAELIGEDSVRDLAVLKINATGLTVLPMGDSDALKVGQGVIAIGTPYNLELAGTMTQGNISGLNREIAITNDSGTVIKTMRLIQTDASINPGNSGGPLINYAGQVIGINSLKLADEFEGIGFAIPINYAADIFNQLIQYGRVVNDPDNDFVTSNARLGIVICNVEDGLRNYFIHPTCEYPTEGVMIVSVEPNTAAYEAGLQSYNIITEFDGEAIKNREDLSNALAKHKAGDVVTIKVFVFSRNFSSGSYQELTFPLDRAM